jgi:thioredoxin-like negative regulator of GroEL
MRIARPAGLLCAAALMFCMVLSVSLAYCGDAATPGKGLEAPRPDLPAPVADAAGAGLARPGEEIPAWKARWELARLLSYNKKLDQAAAQYRQLLKERPELWEARAELARVLSWAGKSREALAELDKLPAGQAGAATLLLKADLLAGAKDYTGAAKLYQRYLEDKPGDLAARFRLAQVLSWAKDYPASLEQYRLILKERPEDTQVRRHYAFVLSWSGQFDAAARELARTLDEAPRD